MTTENEEGCATCETGILPNRFSTFILCIYMLRVLRIPAGHKLRYQKGHVTMGCPYSSGHQSASIQHVQSHDLQSHTTSQIHPYTWKLGWEGDRT